MRSGVVGQCRVAALRCFMQPWPAAPVVGRGVRATNSYFSQYKRDFCVSRKLASQTKGSLGVNPNALVEPSDASRKLFSEIAFAFE